MTQVSYQAMASPPWVDEYYRGNSLEVFFDATRTWYANPDVPFQPFAQKLVLPNEPLSPMRDGHSTFSEIDN